MKKIYCEGIGELIEPRKDFAYKEKKIFVNMFGTQYQTEITFRFDSVNIKEGECGIPKEVANVYKEFFDNFEENIAIVEDMIFKFYNEEIILDDALNQYEDESELKPLLDKKELASKMNLITIYFPYHFDSESVRFGLIFDCDWHEDGFAVKFLNDKIVEMGTTDIIL